MKKAEIMMKQMRKKRKIGRSKNNLEMSTYKSHYQKKIRQDDKKMKNRTKRGLGNEMMAK